MFDYSSVLYICDIVFVLLAQSYLFRQPKLYWRDAWLKL